MEVAQYGKTYPMAAKTFNFGNTPEGTKVAKFANGIDGLVGELWGAVSPEIQGAVAVQVYNLISTLNAGILAKKGH